MTRGAAGRPRHPRLVLGLGLVLAAGAAAAGVATDGSVGPRARLGGPDYVIGADLGATRGGNLFHSFRTFSIQSKETATFTGPDSIRHVISRVTGGAPSNIDGLLRSKVGSADFYFVNPAGVVIGPNARIDVPAALHIGTAQEVRLADGAVFSAVAPGAASTLTSAPPEAFGFLGGPTGDLRVEGVPDGWYDNPDGTQGKQGWHRVANGQAVTLAAANLTLDQQAWVDAPGGRITAVATGDASGRVGLQTGVVEIPANGALTLDHGSGFDTTDYSQATGDGEVIVRAGRGELKNRGFIYADNWSDRDAGGGVDWHSDTLLLDDAYVSAEVYGNGAGGHLRLRVEDQFEVRNNAVVSTWTQWNGDAGDMEITAGSLTLEGSSIWSDASLGDTMELDLIGNAGDVRIEVADRLTMVDSTILSNTWSRGAGGVVDVRAGQIDLTRSSLVTTSRGFGDAGSVRVTADGRLRLVDSRLESSTWSAGDGGALEIRAGSMRMTGSTLNADSYWNDNWYAGNAGSIEVEVAGDLRLTGSTIQSLTAAEGLGGAIDLRAGAVTLERDSSLNTAAEWSGDAGAIRITTPGALTIDDSAINSSTQGSGHAGSIELAAASLAMHLGTLTSESQADAFFNTDYQGGAGRVAVAVTGDALIDQGKVSSSTETVGHAGGVELQVDGRLDLTGGVWVVSDSWDRGAGGDVRVSAGEMGMVDGSLVTADSLWTGPGGNVGVEVAGALTMASGAYIASDAYSSGHGGSVAVHAGQLRMDSGAGIYSEVMDAGDAGSVRVTVDGAAELHTGAVITTRSREFTLGQPGDVAVEAGDLLIADWASINSDTKGDGDGGRVEVRVTGPLAIRDGGRISTSSGGFTWLDGFPLWNGGDAGQVAVQAQRIAIAGGGNPDTGVLSKVYPDSFGAVGDIDIQTGDIGIQSAGRISIENLNPDSTAGLNPHAITLTAHELTLADGGLVTAESLGAAPAGDIDLHLTQALEMRNAAITTAAVDGDGGDIRIDPWLIRLIDSLITTSVTGDSGNGGDITLSADHLVLQGGFIQANTSAAGARGGEITIDVGTLIPEYGQLSVGDPERQAFQRGRNVIQAAAPDGINGEVRITAPELDVTSGLVNLDTGYVPSIALSQSPCGAAAGGSGLTWAGRGGLPWRAGEPYALPLTPSRLERILGPSDEPDAPLGIEAGLDCRFEGQAPLRGL